MRRIMDSQTMMDRNRRGFARRVWAAGLALALFCGLTAGVLATARAADVPVVVFGAASLTDALGEIAGLWQAQGHPAPRLSFASSSTLARQIEGGAPADVFFSADQDWMDYLATRSLIAPPTRADLLGNSLVLVGPKGSAPVRIQSGMDLAGLSAGLPIATGDPDHVPVGRYAQQALEKLGLWDWAQGHLARADSVRAALALVERGESRLGIVYATDAAVSKGVGVLGTFPAGSHAAITYPVAVVADHARPEVLAFRAFLAGPQAAEVFRRYGFTVLPTP